MTASTYTSPTGFRISARGYTILAALALSGVTWVAIIKFIVLPIYHAFVG